MATFSSVLIANRGEIARRIIRACAKAEIRSIAVYSDADREALHVQEADVALHIGPTPATQSYLNIDAILDAARRSGAEAIHPGYGFLSERAEFARRVAEAGLIFIGPTADVMDAMGRKDRAREIAAKAGVPVTVRFAEDDVPADAYPVLVKAAAGGGGKGMHIVWAAADLEPAIATARREATSAFGDNTLLIEKYVEAGRHVEVQIMADQHGNVVHFFERDCSVQRRHQKVVEEAPAPYVSDAVREVLHTSSVALCREVGYTNAGTIEFLVRGDDVYFLEMNTRLQVEHPVTELITGWDLVRLQFAVAAGDELPMTQDDIVQRGHAMEARIYAEDPYAGFLPQAGHTAKVVWPTGVRVDAALTGGQEVPTAYDPMLAKIIVHGPNREAARLALVDALDETAIFGLTTNTGFVRRLVASDTFRDGNVHTGWLDADPEAGALLTRPAVPAEAGVAAAHEWAQRRITGQGHPYGGGDGWRLGAEAAPVRITLVDETGERTHYEFARVDDAGVETVVDAAGITIVFEGQPWRFTAPDPMRAGAALGLAEANVVAPMPGTVLSVVVAVGDDVARADVLGVMEAMKMELALKAPHDGRVSVIEAMVGGQVALGDLLFTVDPVGDGAGDGGSGS